MSFELFVHRYFPEKLYGFVVDAEIKKTAFFHLGAFHPGNFPSTKHSRCEACKIVGCSWTENLPPPILGERVEVEVDWDSGEGDKAPKAAKTIRLDPPVLLEGFVEIFDATRGYGFVKGEDGIMYHLHKSEITEKRIPRLNQTILFYAGVRNEKPRACHAKVCQT